MGYRGIVPERLPGGELPKAKREAMLMAPAPRRSAMQLAPFENPQDSRNSTRSPSKAAHPCYTYSTGADQRSTNQKALPFGRAGIALVMTERVGCFLGADGDIETAKDALPWQGCYSALRLQTTPRMTEISISTRSSTWAHQAVPRRMAGVVR